MLRGLCVAILASACTCEVPTPPGPFHCEQDGDCVHDFVCIANVCVKPGGPAAGGGAGGGVAGGDGGGVAGGGSSGGGGGGGGSVESALLSFRTAPVVPAARCVQLTLDITGALVDHTVTFSTSPAGLSLFVDAACQLPLTALLLGPSAVSSSLYVRALTAQAYDVTAMSAGLPQATASLTVLPIVRRGRCLLPAGMSVIDCTVSPPQQDILSTWLVFQASGFVVDDIASTATRCVLATPTSVRCDRQTAMGDVLIAWQTAELPGLSVQRAEARCNDAGTEVMQFPRGVDPSASFVTYAARHTGAGFSGNDAFSAQLRPDGGAVDLTWAVKCDEDSIISGQVVEWPGMTVTRGVLRLDAGASHVQSAARPGSALATTFALATWSTLQDFPEPSCISMGRVGLSGNAIVTFDRNADAMCTTSDLPEISFERVDVGARGRVQHVAFALDGGDTRSTVRILPVDATRTLVFAGGQTGDQGLATGEGALGIPRTTSDFAALLLLETDGGIGSDQFAGERASARAEARWTVFVLELSP